MSRIPTGTIISPSVRARKKKVRAKKITRGLKGRPSGYSPALCDTVRKLALLKATDAEICDALDIPGKTFSTWKQKHVELRRALQAGKLLVDAEIAQSMYDHAKGFQANDSHVSSYQGEITVTPIKRYIAPDYQSGAFWLTNRHPDKWRNKQELEHSGKISLIDFLEQA